MAGSSLLNGSHTNTSQPIRGDYFQDMQRLLAPAISYLNTLNYRQKFLMVGLVWLVLLGALTAASIARIERNTIILVTVIGTANAIYLTAALYESITSITARLNWASRRMLGSAPVEPIKV